MSDDLLQQLSSNSNSSLDPSMSQKMAKLEARMAGKAAPMSPQAPWLSELMSNGVTTISASGDSDSDVNCFHLSLAVNSISSLDVNFISVCCFATQCTPSGICVARNHVAIEHYLMQ